MQQAISDQVIHLTAARKVFTEMFTSLIELNTIATDMKGDPSAVSSRDIELGSFFTVILLQPTLRYKSLYNTQNSKKVVHSITEPTSSLCTRLQQVGLGHKIMEVLNKMEGGHHQIACRLVFELTHPNYHGNLVVDHVQGGWG
ncbi:uncharacterized protein [Dysidea avara]|uniref:uncharacterized protein isoform X1 n=1 Tax=Dysidea avara TaxID=196820 RepID=UPI00332385E0